MTITSQHNSLKKYQLDNGHWAQLKLHPVISVPLTKSFWFSLESWPTTTRPFQVPIASNCQTTKSFATTVPAVCLLNISLQIYCELFGKGRRTKFSTLNSRALKLWGFQGASMFELLIQILAVWESATSSESIKALQIKWEVGHDHHWKSGWQMQWNRQSTRTGRKRRDRRIQRNIGRETMRRKNNNNNKQH